MISDTVIDVIRAALGTTGGSAHVCVLSGTNAGSASITTSNVAVPSRGRFLLYSVTKTIMAVAALRLVQEGRLRLDQNVSHWLPEFPPARDFSLRQILQHTSGLPDYGGLKEYPTPFVEATSGRRPSSWPGRTRRGCAFLPGAPLRTRTSATCFFAEFWCVRAERTSRPSCIAQYFCQQGSRMQECRRRRATWLPSALGRAATSGATPIPWTSRSTMIRAGSRMVSSGLRWLPLAAFSTRYSAACY
jgi:beta-lactamase family protein